MSVPRTIYRLAAGVLTAALLVAGCGGAEDIAGDADSPSPGVTSEPETTEPTTSGSTGFVEPPPGSGLDRYYDQQLDWSDCGEAAECATTTSRTARRSRSR